MASCSYDTAFPDARYHCCHVIVQNITQEGLTQRLGE
jgi:hypothetical protein